MTENIRQVRALRTEAAGPIRAERAAFQRGNMRVKERYRIAILIFALKSDKIYQKCENGQMGDSLGPALEERNSMNTESQSS